MDSEERRIDSRLTCYNLALPGYGTNYTHRETMKPKTHLNESGLYDYAIKALGRHMRTEAELRRLMRMRVEPGRARPSEHRRHHCPTQGKRLP